MRPMYRSAIVGILGLALAAVGFVAKAADASPFVLVGFSHGASGADRLFEIDIQNSSQEDAVVRGRLVAISVYEATPAKVMGISNTTIKAGETKRFETRWEGAPFFGRVRTLLVMTDGHNPSLVASSDFWILPIKMAAIFVGALLLLVPLVLTLMRLPTYLKERVPENMVAYRVEPGDTVVSISVRYSMTWQEIVKANHLKPPYEIKPGKRLFIPKHALQRPKEDPLTQSKT